MTIAFPHVRAHKRKYDAEIVGNYRLCSISAAAFADETLKVRAITHVVSAQALEVGDVD
jgi:hypothetical protein